MTVFNNKDFQMVEALRKLEEATQAITELWDTDFDEVLEEKYPFHQSFDELNSEIQVWSQEARKELIKRY